MSRSRFPSATSLLLAAAGALSAGCPNDETCGPQGASDTGLVAVGGTANLVYGHLTSGLNNDCPFAGAPLGVVSMTIFGMQSDGSGTVALCVSRPDLLTDRAQALGPDAVGSDIRLIDLRGMSADCSFTVDRTQPITGSATSKGLCGNGSDAAGFALTLDGTLSLTRTCGTTVDTIQVVLHGTVAVAKG